MNNSIIFVYCNARANCDRKRKAERKEGKRDRMIIAIIAKYFFFFLKLKHHCLEFAYNVEITFLLRERGGIGCFANISHSKKNVQQSCLF